MSDKRLRELQRAASSGDSGAQTRLLHERLRAEELTRKRIELAAYLGDRIARGVLEEEGPQPIQELGLESWIRGIDDWGREALVRSVIAVGRWLLPGWEDQAGWSTSGGDGQLAFQHGKAEQFTVSLAEALVPRRALEAAEAWVNCPCPMHGVAAEEVSFDPSTDPIKSACLAVARSMGGGVFAAQAIRDAMTALGSSGDAEQQLRTAIRQAVVPWALDEEDPIQVTPRLPRPDPFADEWVKRGWTVEWVRDAVQVTLRVALHDWVEEESRTWPGSPPAGHEQELIEVLDERIWNERRWLPPGLEGQGFTRTIRVS